MFTETLKTETLKSDECLHLKFISFLFQFGGLFNKMWMQKKECNSFENKTTVADYDWFEFCVMNFKCHAKSYEKYYINVICFNKTLRISPGLKYKI